MKIYLIHSSKFDYHNELYTPLKNSSLMNGNEITFLYDHTNNPGSTKDIIKNADLVIAEMSLPSTGSGIELGWADAFNVPIICIFRMGRAPSQFIPLLTKNIVEYSDENDMVEKLKQSIKKIKINS